MSQVWHRTDSRRAPAACTAARNVPCHSPVKVSPAVCPRSGNGHLSTLPFAFLFAAVFSSFRSRTLMSTDTRGARPNARGERRPRIEFRHTRRLEQWCTAGACPRSRSVEYPRAPCSAGCVGGSGCTKFCQGWASPVTPPKDRLYAAEGSRCLAPAAGGFSRAPLLHAATAHIHASVHYICMCIRSVGGACDY